MQENYKTFNLNNMAPNVLLLGNGIPSLSPHAINWEDALGKIGNRKKFPEDYKKIAYSVLATIMGSYEDPERWKMYEKTFGQDEYVYEDNLVINEIVKIPFEAILTTNYTYEIENAIHPNFYKLHSMSSYAMCTEVKEKTNKDSEKSSDDSDNKKCKTPGPYGRISLFDYNRLKVNQELAQDIWHIHGEIRKKSSIVLTHDEYARLARAVVNYNSSEIRAKYKFEKDIHLKSWVDYLLLGNLYIVGLSMDFSEFDLWWMLNRRIRENTYKNIGKVIYYEPENFGACPKKSALEAMGVEYRTLGYVQPQTKDEDKLRVFFNEFYGEVIEDIKNEIQK